MQAFKLYFKIFKSHIKTCLFYIVLFLVIFLVFSNMNAKEDETSFVAASVDLALQDRDHSELSTSLQAYLGEHHELVDIAYDEQSIKDAMYFERIKVYVEIPAHFEEDLRAGKNPKIHFEQKPDYAAGILLEQQVNAYVGNVMRYLAQPGMDVQDAIQAVQNDMVKSVDLQMVNSQDIANSVIPLGMYFQYMSYILMVLFFAVGGMVLCNVYLQSIRMRNLISPISSSRFHVQLFLALMASGFVIWGIFILCLGVMDPLLFSEKGMYMLINSIAFLLVCNSITYLLANLLAGSEHAEEKINGMSNVICLGMSFLGGVFIPQMYLSEPVILIGSFLPTYWYVKAINEIMAIQQFSGDGLMSILQCFGIQLLFALVIFLLSLYVAKMKTSAHALVTNDHGDTHL